MNSGSRRPRKTSARTNVKKEDMPIQLNLPAKRASECEGTEAGPLSKRQKTTGSTKLGTKDSPRGTKTSKKEQKQVVPETPQKPTRRDQAWVRRELQDEKYRNRVLLYKTEVVKYDKYSLGCSDLLALPALLTVNEKNPGGPPCQCFRVFHLDWLQAQIDAGKGIDLPPGSAVESDKNEPQFVPGNGESICRKEIEKRYGPGLLPKQLKRIKPCRKARPAGGARAVEHWNVCDIEALLEQGRNLTEFCPPAPPIQRRRSTMEYTYDDLLEVAEERECPCCVWMGLPG